MLKRPTWLTRSSRFALFFGALCGFTLFNTQHLRAEITAYVIDIQLVSSRRITRDLTDFTYTIRVTNQGGAILNASAFVRSLSSNTVIQDNEVVLGTVPTGSTLTSTDTFTLRQNRLVPFRVQDLVWTIQGQEANTRPSANAGPDQTVPTGTTVTLDGSGSTDADGQPLTYRWSLVARPAGSAAALSNSNQPMPTVLIDRGGDYLFDLIVNDGQIDSLADRMRVSTINSAPVANAGPDRTVPRNSNVQLDGSLSSDPDFDALSYEWSIVLRPTGSVAELVNPTTVMPSLQLDRPGDYRLRLSVRDSQYASSPDFINISTENSNPVANPGPDVQGSRNTPTSLDGSASSDADNDPISYSWTLLSKPANSNSAIAAPALPQTTITPDQYGTYVVQLIVNDGLANSAAATKTISVPQPANRPPNANPDSATTSQNTAITVDVLANDSDPDADAISVIAFSQPAAGGTVTQVAGGLRFTPTAGFTGAAIFGYAVSDGQESDSAAVTVTVQGAQNQAPILNAISNRTINVGSTLRLQLIGSDPDEGDSLTYSLPTAPSGANFNSPRVTWTPSNSQLGAHNFTARVQDTAGAADTETFTVNVVAANRPPLFGPLTDDRTVTLANYGKSVTASDPDGDAVVLTLVEGPAGLTLSGSAVNWRPGATQIGRFTVKLRASDPSGAFTAAQFQVTVEGATPPLARDDEYTVKVGETLNVAAPGVLTNDVSGSGNPLSARKLTDPALGTLNEFNVDGSFTFTPPAVAPMAQFALTGQRLTSDLLVGIDLRDWPALGDLNRDGKPDLITLRYNDAAIIATGGGDGARLWGVNPRCTFFDAGPSQVLADIDDDGRLEYLLASSCPEDNALVVPGGSGRAVIGIRLQALSDDGQPKWVGPILSAPVFDIPCTGLTPDTCSPTPVRVPFGAADFSLLSVARLTENAPPTILLRQWAGASSGAINTLLPNGTVGTRYHGCRLLTGIESDMGQECTVTMLISAVDGSVQQVLRSPARHYNNPNGLRPYTRNPPIAADLDGDGSVEIVSGADVWRRVNGTWTLAWQSLVEPQQVAVVDLDGDGKPEIVQQIDHLTNGQYTGDPIPGFSGYFIYDRNGVEIRRIPVPMSTPGLMTLADVDGDRLPEILSPQDGLVHVLKSDGSFLWTYIIPDNPTDPIQSQAFRTARNTNVLAFDLDGDGIREVVFSSVGWVHILDGPTGLEKARFDAGRRSASPLATALFTHITDWDNDGHADILSIGSGGISNPQSQVVWWIKSTNNDWQPTGKYYGAIDYRESTLDDAGRVSFDTSVSSEFRQVRRLGNPRDPREALGTSFEYRANDGVVDSNNAKVFVKIAPANRPPVITSRPPTAVRGAATATYIYQVAAADPDLGDIISYSLESYGANFGFNNTTFFSVNPATGAVSIATSAGFGEFMVMLKVTATDSQGATATQSFVVSHFTGALVTVPSVVGSLQQAAAESLTAVQLQSGILQEQFSAQPIDTVIAQSPVAGSEQPRGTTVLLTVSKGPAPTVVPNVVGRSQSTANTALTAAGFTAAASRAFSNSVDAGFVISQAVAPGTEQAGGNVGIVVSAGSGLDLRLSRSVTPANEPIPFTLVARDVDGNVIGSPSVTFSIQPDSATTGPVPSVTGNTITAANTTRGRYIVTVTEGSKTARDVFVVVHPNTATKPTQLARFAELEDTLSIMERLLEEANAARLANDTALMTSKMTSWVNTWRALDLERLSFAVPVVTETGFPPEVEDMAGFGVTQTADDVLNKQILADAVEDLLELEEALVNPTTPYQQIRTQFAEFKARAERLRAVNPGEYGVIDAKGLYAELLAHRMPRVMDALVNDIARAFGMPARTRPFPGMANNRYDADSRFASALPATNSNVVEDANAVQISSTLAEQLTTLAVQEVVDAMGGGYTYRKFLQDAAKGAMWGGVVTAAVAHIRATFQSGDLTVTTGASLTINVFNAQYSTIEGIGLNRRPSLNKVMMIGPALVTTTLELAEKLKALGGLPSTAVDVTKATNLDELNDGLDDLEQPIEDALEAAQNLAEAVRNTYQDPRPGSEVSDCLFELGPLCRSIQYANGFKSVYKTLALNLPAPILFLVVNTETGATLIARPNFVPGN